MTLKNPKKILVLKLGGMCNLKCKHCHCTESNYEFDPAVIDYIKDNGYTRVTFCGGEPTLYFETIKKVVEQLPESMGYKLVTNGTKLNSSMVAFFNEHNFTIVASYDGENDSRDRHVNPNWRAFSRLKDTSIATLYSESNADYYKLRKEVDHLLKFIGKEGVKSLWLNFPHQTNHNENTAADKELARKYCQIIGNALEADMVRFKAGDRQELNVLWMAFNKWGKRKDGPGVACCNEHIHALTLDGRFLMCPYNQEYIGDINSGIDFAKVASHIPQRCKSCSIWEYCHNSCIANITENECYIAKILHKHLYKLMDKYQVTYEELLEYEKGK